MDAPWLRVARELVGIKEVRGKAADPRIVELFRLAGFPEYKSDETAWCAAFVGACLRLAGFNNKATLAAAGYLDFGKDLGRDPVEGCIAVLKPLVPHSTGHVGFYVGESANQITLLGGNQHDSVSQQKFSKNDVRSYRWPNETAAIATSELIKNITQLDSGYVLPKTPDIIAASQPTYAAFDTVAPIVEQYEGGYVDNPSDPGGPTNMGVTLATLQRWRGHPVNADEVRALTRSEERDIYRKYYWEPILGDQLPPPCALMTFNASILQGPSRACVFLQEALNEQGLGVDVDGENGTQTLGAVGKCDLKRLVHDYSRKQLEYLQTRTGWSNFGRGWTNRLNDVESKAAALAALQPTPLPIPPVPEPEEKTMSLEEILRFILATAESKAPVASPTTPSTGSQITKEQILQLLLTAIAAKQPQPSPGTPSSPKQIDTAELLTALLPLLAEPTQPADTSTTSSTPVISKPSVQLSVAGLGISTILQVLGLVGTPFGMGAMPTQIGTLATLIPILTGAVGATGGFGALLNIGRGLLGGLAKR